MRVAIVHNHYRNRGGEDEVFEAEARLLRRHRHDVIEVTATAADPDAAGPWGKARLAAAVIWSREWYGRMDALLRRVRPEVVHVHNVFPSMSPAVHHACRRHGVPVVQTLHNFRLVCPAACCYRGGRLCHDCVGRVAAWPGVVHGCYHESRARTAVVAAMLGAHRLLGTWRRDVDVYVALSECARRIFLDGGLPADRIVVNPNFVDPDPGPGEHRGGAALFAGRLAAYKGVRTLVAAWGRLGGRRPLTVFGDGPLATLRHGSPPGITWAGHQPREIVLAAMKEARILVFPSECYEGCPVALVEAFATGLPVIASRVGAAAEVVEDGRTGLLFAPGDAGDLAAKVEWAFTHSTELETMGRNARREFETRYTAERGYERLLTTYRMAAARAGTRS